MSTTHDPHVVAAMEPLGFVPVTTYHTVDGVVTLPYRNAFMGLAEDVDLVPDGWRHIVAALDGSWILVVPGEQGLAAPDER